LKGTSLARSLVQELLVENVYKINFSELVDQKVFCLLSMNDKKWVWHRRLGHAN